MTVIEISESLAKDLFDLWDKDDTYEEPESLRTWKLVETGSWSDEGKYDYKDNIYEYEGRFYRLTFSRSGSYYSDYYYNYPNEAFEVHQVEKTITVWELVEK